MSLTSAFGRPKKEDCQELKASLNYIANSSPAWLKSEILSEYPSPRPVTIIRELVPVSRTPGMQGFLAQAATKGFSPSALQGTWG